MRVSDLSARFGVSTVTVRTDLQSLESHGRVRRIRGGAMSPGIERAEQPFEVAEHDLATEKAAIGQLRGAARGRRRHRPARRRHDDDGDRPRARGAQRAARGHRGHQRPDRRARARARLAAHLGGGHRRDAAAPAAFARQPAGHVLLEQLNASIAFIGCNGVDVARRGDQRQPARGRGQARDAAQRAPPGRGGRRLEARRGRGGEDLRSRRGEPRRHRLERRPVDPRRPRGGGVRRAGRRRRRDSLAARWVTSRPSHHNSPCAAAARRSSSTRRPSARASSIAWAARTRTRRSSPSCGRRRAFWVADEAPASKNFSPESLGGSTVKLLLIDRRSPGGRRARDRPGRHRGLPGGAQHGWLLGRIEDPFGHHWEIGKPLVDWPPSPGP